jgi:hypothetical protein
MVEAGHRTEAITVAMNMGVQLRSFLAGYCIKHTLSRTDMLVRGDALLCAIAGHTPTKFSPRMLRAAREVDRLEASEKEGVS